MRRRHQKMPDEAVTLGRSSVHILYTEEELKEAVERASGFDQWIADVLQNRSRHYWTLVENPLDQADAD